MTEVVPELVQSKFGVDRRHPLVRVAAALERLSTAFASRVIVVSRPAQAAAAGRGLPGRKTLTIMNSPDPAIFPSAARKPSPRLALGPRLISHGTLVDRYGFDTLIEAMPHILERHPSAKLQVLGDGPLRGRLEEIVSARNLAEHVELCGQVPLTEIAARLRVADLGIVANRRDPFTDLVVPTKLMEYAVMGVPVAAARTSAIEEYFGESVALFDPGDPASLGDVVARLLSAPDERARLACAAEAVVRNELDWERHMARDYVRLYDHLTVSSQDAM
jgi:glycosyltransferase involved in cell wall biosynthesis